MANDEKPKLGQGHLKATLRQGAKEVAQILQAFPPGPVQPVEEPGLFGNLTPQEIVQDKGAQRSYESMLRGYASTARVGQERQAPER